MIDDMYYSQQKFSETSVAFMLQTWQIIMNLDLTLYKKCERRTSHYLSSLIYSKCPVSEMVQINSEVLVHK